MDEDPEDVKKNMSKFGWDIGKLEEEKKIAFINVSPVRVAPSEKAGLIQLGMKEFKLIKLLEAIRTGIEEVQVEKMRGLEVDNQPRPYNITNSGIEVYPTLTVFRRR
ncbi:hypothetical protein ES703_123986 [subsurface metagenome]